MAQYKVGFLVGSLATASINRKLAKALVKLAPPSLALTEIPIRDLPLYSQDYDADFPPVAKTFKAALSACDALLFVTPEYNRSIPGGLKNALDWGTRPYGQNGFTGKPTAVIGTSPGAIGTALSQRDLRAVLTFCAAPMMQQPEAYLQFKEGLINDEGEVSVDGTRQFLATFMRAFEAFIGKTLG
ncbi:NAD(P)H-dependent oxidoreductase [Rhodovarius crocodyli]|uniref:NAD(P)H-dependent oxidoreductase n=1 Tax=Rhodovarius crocodyli TaxID=1979269 RepID=A0A437MPD9_9PROT|nr:NADPH-dependent FMN reductase [Rhodovarius crocodyli]RVT99501.1 NAD(P)H-dependent oxidoreductase [Rhodovarius crocodyli]